MTIDIKEIIDYCNCPMYYKLKYKSPDLKNNMINILERYDDVMHKTIYSFFSEVQDKQIPTISNLKKTFGNLWIQDKTVHGLLYSKPASWRDNRNEKRKSGIIAIMNIWNTFKDNPGLPLVVNKKFSLPINSSLTLTGTWEVIREVEISNRKQIQIIDFKIDDRLHNKMYVDNDLEITAESLAFRNLFKLKEDRIAFYGLNKNKIYATSRTKEDYKILVHTVKCIATAINKRLFYACPSDQCYTCIYKDVCYDSFNLKNMI